MFTLPILLGLTVSKPVFITLAAATAGLGGYLLIRGDSRVESRRRGAAKLSRIAAENGLPIASSALEAYAVGDYSGALAGIGHLHDTLTDDKQRKAALQVFLETQLDLRLNNKELREELFQAIEKKTGFVLPRDAAIATVKAA